MYTQKVIVLAGTSGTGKSTVASELKDFYSGQLPHLQCLEGDDLHPPANVAKMAAGTPLQDDDRWDWLRDVAHKSTSVAKEHHGISFVTCSSLKKKYRDLLRETEPTTQFYFIFLFANKDHINLRLTFRKGHFMKAKMMESQFKDLELPEVGKEKNCTVIQLDDKDPEQVEKEVLVFSEKAIHNEDF